MRKLLTAAIAVLLILLGATAGKAWSPWLSMTTPCDDAPQAIAMNDYRIAVVCSGDSHIHYKVLSDGN